VSPDTLALLRARGHTVVEGTVQGVAEVIIDNPAAGVLEGGLDRRQPDGAAVGH
jgi:gamma-glutamyltranspeptidase/glutathione hydrolase